MKKKGSDRASALMNLNRRAPPPPPTPPNNRHSFAIGDTEELSRMFGQIGTDWTSKEQQRIPPRAASNLRPKSVMELGGTTDPSFSNSWLNQRQPTLFNNDNVIERPRSADISSWHVPSSASWKPLGSDLNWKEPMQRFNSIVPENASLKPDEIIRNRRASAVAINNRHNTGFTQQYLSPPQNNSSRRSSSAEVVHDTLPGYGSDQSDNSAHSRYRGTIPSGTHPTTIIENNKEDDVDMELLQGNTNKTFAWTQD